MLIRPVWRQYRVSNCYTNYYTGVGSLLLVRIRCCATRGRCVLGAGLVQPGAWGVHEKGRAQLGQKWATPDLAEAQG